MAFLEARKDWILEASWPECKTVIRQQDTETYPYGKLANIGSCRLAGQSARQQYDTIRHQTVAFLEAWKDRILDASWPEC